MPEVISIGHDDDLDDDDYGPPPGDRPRPNIALFVIIGGVLLLVAVIAYLIFSSGGDSAPTTTTTAVAAPSTTAVTPLAASDSKAKAVQAALDSWAKFVNTGDLAVVKDTFDQNGPQYVGGKVDGKDVGFVQEAANNKARGQFTGTYTAKASNFGTVADGAKGPQVVADVVWSQSGKDDASVRWVFELVGAADGGAGWRVWTVRTASDGAAATAPKDFCSAVKAAAAVPGNVALNEQFGKTKKESDRVKILRENTAQRLAAWKDLQAVAPTELKANVDVVVTGLEAQNNLVNGTTDLNKIDKGLANDTAIKAITNGLEPVVSAAQSQCQVELKF